MQFLTNITFADEQLMASWWLFKLFRDLIWISSLIPIKQDVSIEVMFGEVYPKKARSYPKCLLVTSIKWLISYTAQYAVTATGNLLPRVFLCMQEPKGEFGPRVKQQVTLLEEKFGNVYATASKSGKLMKEHFNEFVAEIMKPYCKDSDFLLILDLWGGRTDISLFNSHFTDDGNCTATVEVIPPHCTSFGQPCDVYFFRPVKNLRKVYK